MPKSITNQRDLNRRVAQATGESVETISRMGFIPLPLEPVDREPLIVDWDAFDDSRSLTLLPVRRRGMA